MAAQKAATAELMKLAQALPGLIKKLDADIADISARMVELQKAGLVYATEHWRKGADGEPKYLYLLYPQKTGEPRKREYVGCDPVRVAEARAAIVRAGEYDELAGRLAALSYRARSIGEALDNAYWYLTRQY